MWSCFLCGRGGSAFEPTPPPSSQAKKLSLQHPGVSSISAKTKNGGVKFSVNSAKSTDSPSPNDATTIISSPQNAKSEGEYPLGASDCHTLQKEVVKSTIRVRGKHNKEHRRCVTQEVHEDYVSAEEDEHMISYDKKFCNAVIETDSMSSKQDKLCQKTIVQYVPNELLSCQYVMREDDSIPCNISSSINTCTDTLADVKGEITINTPQEEAARSKASDVDPRKSDVNAVKSASQSYEAHDKAETYSSFPKFVDTGPHPGTDVKWKKHKHPGKLFSYGISDQQRDFMFLCAGLVIQAVGFQLKSIVEVVTTVILLGYRVYFFASGVVDWLSHIKKKLAEARTKLLAHVVAKGVRESLALRMENLGTMKPLLIRGARKMGWGCLKAAYILVLLTALLCISFAVSFFAVKGRSRMQLEPIHITQELHFDYTKSHPVASLDLLSLDTYHKSNASKGIKVNPTAIMQYRCTMILTLPESEYNRNLGIFQVLSELLSETGDTLLKASQPCMLHFKSSTLHYVRSICLAIPLLAGVASETQTLSLHLLEWQQDAVSPPMSASVLRIFLVPRAGKAVSTGLPELYKAEVQVESVYWMPSTATSSGIKTLLMWIGLSFLLFGLLSSFCMYRMHHQNKNKS